MFAPAYNLRDCAPHDIFIRRGRLVDAPAPYSHDIDLRGHIVRPAFINPHDHLELNHYPRTRLRGQYASAHDWGDDVNARLNLPLFSELRAFPLWDRCFIGGLKNLLSGVTTVAQHGPLHPPLRRRAFPVRVLRRYGWAHSLHFDTPEQVQASYRATPPDVPWFIHLAEGTDERAASEYERLRDLGCIGPNTVIVHGVGLTDAQIADAAPRVRGLVWCPTTNTYLLGRSANISAWRASGGTVALGSDSRLTADGDLLDESRQADADALNPIYAAHILGLGNVGHLRPGAHADLVALTDNTPIPARRTALTLVMRGGVPQVGTPDMMAKFAHTPQVRATLDGVPRAVHRALARQIAHCTLTEPGLTLHL